MAKHIIFIHGRHFKPAASSLEYIWLRALREGISRDFGKDGVDKLNTIKQSVIYYGDLSNEFLYNEGMKYNERYDVSDRQSSLNNLESYKTKDFNKSTYKNLYERNGTMKILANMFSNILAIFGLGELIIGKYAPDIKEYWNSDSSWGSDIRERLTTPLVKALEDDDEILIIAHSLGAMVAYDVFWKLSYYGEYKHLRDKKVNFVTIGSPLGDPTVKKKLKGHGKGTRAYPSNINKWFNVAAADDYISHVDHIDCKFDNPIDDIQMYNIAMRYTKSNPHHNAGYLISPSVSRIVADWMKD